MARLRMAVRARAAFTLIYYDHDGADLAVLRVLRFARDGAATTRGQSGQGA
jgi:hypothetical protein